MSESSYDSDSSSIESYNSNGTSVSSKGTGRDDFSNFIDLQNKVIGNYHLIKILGQGAYAQVWLAYNHIKDNFFALKIQHPDDFESAKEEVKILNKIEKLPHKIEVLDSFVFILKDDGKKEKYYVIVFPVYGSSIENLIKLDQFKNGFDESIVMKFTQQTLENFVILHNKYNLIHCDIKPDNFLLSTPDTKILKIMECYPRNKFKIAYEKILEKKPELKKSKENEMLIREKLHNELIRDIDFESISKLEISEAELLEQLKSSNFLISDFGSFCEIDEKYDNDFGTRYYRSPENILVSNDLNYGTDIWSLGCTIYELLRNRCLFNPSTTTKYSADHHHLSSIFQLGKFSNKEIKSFGRKKEFFTKNKELVKLPKTSSIIDKLNKLDNNYWKGLILSMLTVSFKKRACASKLLASITNQKTALH